MKQILEEEWIKLEHELNLPKCIVEVSNRGRIKRLNGSISWSTLRQHIRCNGKYIRVYHLLADRFIPKTDEDMRLGRDMIDHITHNPDGMNVNDVRNLRWCTFRENLNFEEARRNNSISKKGIHAREKSSRWGEISCDFSKKFTEHYGIHRHENEKLYHRDRVYFSRTGKFRWEVENG